MASYREIEKCRLGSGRELITVLDLGEQALTGVFPRSVSEAVSSGPLQLVWCPESGLLQLKHSYDPDEMYGENYGYRSGLNASMVAHLQQKVAYLERLAEPMAGDVALDIGSNDGTTLAAYQASGLRKVGIDPTGEKFRQYYPPDVELVPTFFSASAYHDMTPQPAKIITSIAMFYDLDSPIDFVRDIESVLADDGIWHFEQSYMPSMLRLNSYDTVCHEHLEYYSLAVVRRILDAAGLKIIDVAMNGVNGGSFAVTAAKRGNTAVATNDALVDWMLGQEERLGLDTVVPYQEFQARVARHREDLRRLILGLNEAGKKVLGYGASTKGNVVLQYCGLSADEIVAIAEVNEDKFDCVTPGTGIPIISEAEARAMRPDYFLVLPWHFKTGILSREKEFLAGGGRMIFPFPEIEIY